MDYCNISSNERRETLTLMLEIREGFFAVVRTIDDVHTFIIEQHSGYL